MNTICPRCGMRYQGPGYCTACGAQVMDETQYQQMMRQQQQMAVAQYPQTVPPQPPYQQMPMPQTTYQASAQPEQQSGLSCPKCGSHNVIAQVTQDSERTVKKGVGFGGHVNNAARGATALMTLGMSNLVWKKNKGTNHTKVKTKTLAVCQNCGKTWQL